MNQIDFKNFGFDTDVSKSNVNDKNAEDVTRLMIACEKGDITLAEYLLSIGANIDEHSSTGATALTYALSEKHSHIAKFLLEKGCDIDFLCDNNPLSFWCIKFGTFDIFEHLFQYDTFRKTVDYLMLESTIRLGREEFIPFIISNVTFNELTMSDISILVAKYSSFEILKLIFNHKVSPLPNYIGSNKSTALIESIKNKSLEKVKYLVGEKKFDVNLVDSEGLTPIIVASKVGNVEIFDFLISNGANINQSFDKFTPIFNAVRFKNHDLIIYLIEKGVDITHTFISKDLGKEIVEKMESCG